MLKIIFGMMFLWLLGFEKADVINCKTGATSKKLDIGIFWRGFESVKGIVYSISSIYKLNVM